ncbi:MAG: N-acetyltransferase [Herpetosiphonaceae bacterium]|nr:MAG: N-acetyltransferase [Herpetosiphonaceae bacterium]
MPDLQTARLTTRSFTLDLVRAALDDRTALARLLEAQVPDDWPGPDVAEILPLLKLERERNPQSAQWSGLILHSADRILIGDIGFKGGPNSASAVEIGYSIIPAYRRQGYASEAAQAMIKGALAQPGVAHVTAECLIDNIGSIRVLERIGMRRVGLEETHEGTLIKWELLPDQAPPA